MPGSKVLVLGGTGAAGICLLRELLHRKHKTTVYCRNPAKVPPELASDPNLEVMKGEMDDTFTLGRAVSDCNVILSILGPTTLWPESHTLYSGYYRALFPLMREHGVKKIYTMATVSISDPLDRPSFIRALIEWIIYLFANGLHKSIAAMPTAFEEEGEGLDWTVYRLAGLSGGSSKEVWEREREGDVFAGYVAEAGWCGQMSRSQLARWLVDCAEGRDEGRWVRKMPAVSSMSWAGKQRVD